MPIRILIADDQRLFRQSLKYLLEQEEDMKVVERWATGRTPSRWPRSPIRISS